MTIDQTQNKPFNPEVPLDAKLGLEAQQLMAGTSTTNGTGTIELASPRLSEKEHKMFGDLLLCSADPTDFSNKVYKDLPPKIAVVADKDKVAIGCDDAVKLFKAIPGFKVSDSAEISGLKKLQLDGTNLTLEGKGEFVVDDGKGGKVTINLNDVKSELKLDSKEPGKVTLSNISGLTVMKGGAEIAIKQVSIKLQEDKDGNLSLKVTPDQLAGQEAKAKDVLSRLQSGYNSVAAKVGQNVIDSFEIPLCNKKDAPISEVFSEVGNWIANPKDRDVNRVAESVAGLYIDPQFSGLFKGIKGIEKNGDNFVLKTDGGDSHQIGGLPLAWDKEIKAKIEAGTAPKLTIESGMKVRLPLPDDVAAACGLKNPQEYDIKELSLSDADKNGHRIATLKMDGPVQSVSIKVDARFEPVPVDKAGNVQVDARLKDANVGLQLQFDPKQAMSGKTDQINFKLTVSDNHGQLPDAIEKFFNHKLDDNLRTVLTGIRTLERSGDKISIGRADATSHELGGLRVGAAKDISFKLKSDEKGVSISELSGVKITSLPGHANTIYATRLPITLTAVHLGAANKDGNRTLGIEATGAVRTASVDLDAAMTPKNIYVTVENPVDAFKESIQGRAAAHNLMSARLKDNTKYQIHIKGNGEVDYGGLGAVADMFSKAGDLISIEGAAATAIGYVGNKLTQPPGSTKAEEDLWDTAKRSWRSIFP